MENVIKFIGNMLRLCVDISAHQSVLKFIHFYTELYYAYLFTGIKSPSAIELIESKWKKLPKEYRFYKLYRFWMPDAYNNRGKIVYSDIGNKNKWIVSEVIFESKKYSQKSFNVMRMSFFSQMFTWNNKHIYHIKLNENLILQYQICAQRFLGELKLEHNIDLMTNYLIEYIEATGYETPYLFHELTRTRSLGMWDNRFNLFEELPF